jgi:DNA (cytosine-5)-methyltransferase 1
VPRKLLVADLFCGAGGTTTGAMQAIHALDRDVEFVAVNHWPVAIATHSANHPDVRHYCKDLDTANPNEIVPEGRLDLLLASPECRFHSTAQGGRPLDEQNRASAWHVVRWAERLYIKRIVVENVPRFVKWGPLDAKGRPIKKREGELFFAWVHTLEAIGYRVEWRVLNAADYGTPQTRKRLFVQARRDGRRIVWPDQTHAARGREHMLHGRLKTWTPARAVIKFDKYRHKAKPVEEKDLAPKTLERIAEGARRFCGLPFTVANRTNNVARSVDEPMACVTTSPGGGIMLAEPFVVTMRQHTEARSVEEPLTTVTTSGNHHVLIEPFVLPQGGGGVARSIEDPLPTVATDGAIGVLEPFLLVKRQETRTQSIEDPLPTVTTSGRNHFVIEPFLVESNHGKERPARSLDDPLPTITQKNGLGVVEPAFIVPQQGDGVRSVDEPLPTIVAQGRSTGLVEPVIDGETKRLVWLHRMLEPEELAEGQDFIGYAFTGTREQQTAQIGNAVPIKLACAMTAAAFHDLKPVERETEDAA